jgi:carbon-monoxide dehydrogenase medium subunit
MARSCGQEVHVFDLESLKRPTTPEEAVSDLLETDGSGLYLAGGTIVVPTGSPGLDFLVDLSRLGLEFVRVEKNGSSGAEVLTIGAMTRISDLMGDPAIGNQNWRSIREACYWLATHTVRNQATVGGNLTAAHFPSDLPPVFLSLDASIVVQGKDGRREVRLEDLYGSRSENHRRGDLILEVHVPAGPEGQVAAFEKTGRARVDVAVVNCAVALAAPDGTISAARVALSGLTANPLLVAEVSDFLAGKAPSEDLFAEAGRLVASTVSPRSDHRAGADYRKRVAGVLTERALTRAASGADAEES